MADDILSRLQRSRRRRSWVTAGLFAVVAVVVVLTGLRIEQAGSMESGSMGAIILASALIVSAFVLGYFYVLRQWLASQASVSELLAQAIEESARFREDLSSDGSPSEPSPSARERSLRL